MAGEAQWRAKREGSYKRYLLELPYYQRITAIPFHTSFYRIRHVSISFDKPKRTNFQCVYPSKGNVSKSLI